jgi:CHAT domain-containing protein/HEPN domain-containing protein
MPDALSTIFPPQQISAAFMPVFALVRDWQTITLQATPGFLRTEAVLSASEAIVGREPLASLRSAVAAKDPRALAAVEMLSRALKPVAEMMKFVCIKLRDSGRFHDMRAEAERLQMCGEAIGLSNLVMDALFLQASASRRLQDPERAIAAYRRLLDIAPPDNKKVRSAAFDNLALNLVQIGEYDEALAGYNESEKAATTPGERAAILLNRAQLRHLLGDLSRAQIDLEASKSFRKQVAVEPTEWGIVYDFEAQLKQSAGQVEEGLAIALKAKAALVNAPPRERATNAMIRADLHKQLDQGPAASAAFDEALALAEHAEGSDISEAFYRSGFEAALKKQLPSKDEVHKLFWKALALDSQGKFQQSQACFAAASSRARQNGDILTALRVEMNLAGQLQKVGQVVKAGTTANHVRQLALQHGLASVELGAIVTLSSLRDDGSDRGFDSLFGYARARVLLSLHRKFVSELKLDAGTAVNESLDAGTLENQLAKLAEKVGAYETAVGFARVAVEKAMKVAPFDWITANRLSGLLQLYRKLKRADDASATAERIRLLLANDQLTTRARLIAGRSMGSHLLTDAPEQAEQFIKTAIDAAEEIRRDVADLAERAVFDRQYRDIYPKYAMLLRKAGKVEAAFEALQFGRGRAFLDAARDDKPAGLDEIQRALPAGESLVEFAAEQNGIAAYLVTSSGLDVVIAEGDLDSLRAADLGDMRQRAAKLVEICRNSPLILQLIAGVAQHISAGGRVLLAPDIELHNLPLHITPVDGQPWCERFSIGYLPNSAFLLSRAKAVRGSVFVAGNSRGDLPGADAECDEVAALYGIPALKQRKCTLSAMENALKKGPIDIVHLAVHGRGNPRRGSQSSLMFATEDGGIKLVDLEALAKQPWPAKLVVLSGCSTGLGGLRDGRELVSVAGRILQSGAKAVVASLWAVGDENARTLMRAFHTALKDAPGDAKDYRNALDVARAALTAEKAASPGTVRDGRDILPEEAPIGPADAEVSRDLDWASFVVVGDAGAAREPWA